MQSTHHKLSLLVAASALALGATGARAQDIGAATTPSSAAAASAATDSRGAPPSDALEEIVVTAQRRTESLQRAAASVSVRDGPELLAQGRYQLSQILEDVPGVSGGAANSPGGMRQSSAGTDSPSAGLFIRGIPSNVGVGGSATSISTSAALYVDGVYNGTGSTYDIDRVEVLRGPQGTLYGRSATSGVVAIHTRNPDLSRFGGDLAIERGNYDLGHYTGALNVPIIEDKLAFRLSGNYYDRDGYDTHGDGGAMTNKDYRAKLLFRPTDDFSLLLGFSGEDNKAFSAGTTFTLTSPDDYDQTFTPVGPGKNHFRQYWAELNWSIGGVTLTYEPAYRTWRSEALNFVRIPAVNISSDQTIRTPKDHFWTHELRLASDQDQKISWQAGALYYDNELRNISESRDGVSGALQFSSDTSKKVTEIGVFGEATYAFTDDWRLTGGLRYDHTKVKVGQIYTANLNLGGLFGGGPPGSPTSGLPEVLASQTLSGSEGVRKFNNVTYKLRLEHDLTPHNLVYALTSSGFSPGDLGVTTGANLAPVSVVFDAETLTAYEIGSKNRFLGDRLQVNGALFYYVYGGYQVASINVSTVPGTSAFAAISAPARAYGGELEVLYRPTPRDRIGLNVGYINAYFVRRSEQVVEGSGGRTFDFYFSKSRIPNSTPFTAQLNYDHDFDLFRNSRLTLHGDVRVIGAYDTTNVTQSQRDNGAAPYARTGTQVIGDVTATWVSGDGHFSVSAYLRNIGNNRYKINAGINDGFFPGTFNATTELYDPRTYGVILAARF